LKIGETEDKNDFYTFIKELAKKDSFQDLPKPLLDLSVEYKNNVVKVASVIYLLGKIKKGDIKTINKFLKLEKQKIDRILKDLKVKNILYFKGNLIFYKNVKDEFKKDIGLLILYEGISKLVLEKIFEYFPNNEKQQHIFLSLGKVFHPVVNEFLHSHVHVLNQEINTAKNNDDIFINLEFLKQYIGRVPDQAIKILKFIINLKNPLKAVTRHDKVWGKIEGKSHDNLIEKSIELLELLRYIKQKDVFNLLLKLVKSSNNSIKEKANNVFKKIAGYDHTALQKIGYQPQFLLLDEIEKYKDRKLIKYFETLSVILTEIIKPSFKGGELTNYDTFTFYRGGLVASERLQQIRSRAITIIEKLYLLSKTNQQRKNILRILNQATQLPSNYKKELENLILINTNEVIEFYIKIIENADNEIIKKIEEQLYRPHGFIHKDLDKIKNIKKLQSLIAKDNDYGIFKIFVGYDYYFDEKLDWKKAKEVRKNKIQEFVDSISDENYDEWEKKILMVLDSYKNNIDYSKYQYFNIFLNKLGEQKPEITLKLIKNKERALEYFLVHLVAGIWKSKNKKNAITLIENWNKSNKYLSVCSYIFCYVKEINEKLILKVFQKAKEIGDENALININLSIIENYQNTQQYNKLFIKTIKELTKHKNYYWVNNIPFKNKSIIENLTEKDYDIILNNLLLATDIDYPIETALSKIAEKYPQKIIKYFEKRVNIQSKKKRGDSYYAIPYKLNQVNKVLVLHKNLVFEEILEWFRKKKGRLHWEGKLLLKNIFSINQLDDELISLLDTKEKENIKIVLSVFSAYQGIITIDNKSLQKFIREHNEYHDEIIPLLIIITTLTAGEHGYYHLLKKKKEDLQKWKTDKRKYIRDFVKKYEKSLDKDIDYEKKRADESLELRKHGY